MKNISIILATIILCASFFSCTTSQTISVIGTPGTTIYTPGMDKKWTIQQNGKCDIKLASQDYHHYLLSKEANSDLLVPFALDYKKRNYIGTQFAAALGKGIAFSGLAVNVASIIAMLAGDTEIGGTLFLTGCVTTGIGAAIGMPADFRMQQDQQMYKFKYLSEHATNDDITFVPIVDHGISKNASSETSTPTTAATSKAKSRTTKSNKTLNDYAKQIEGTYIGKGSLIFENEVIETYNNIKVVVKRIDKNTVNVNVIESNGEDFFASVNKYEIAKNGNKYTLTLQGIPSAQITITNKQLKYNHPKVNIDNDIYTLDISASKK